MNSIASLPETERHRVLERIAPAPDDKSLLAFKWRGWRARPEQLPPEDDEWLVWLLLAGRGFGKTRTGAETVRAQAETAQAARVALVAPTAADVRNVMVEGESGIMAISPPWFRPVYEPSKRKLTWPNGAVAMCYSADEPERLRGPQHDLAWTASPDSDIAWYGIFESADAFFLHATQIATVTATHYVRTGLGNAVTRYYWVRAVNTSGFGNAYIGPASGTTLLVPTADLVGQIVGAQIAANTIAASNLISGNDIVQVVGTISLASSSVSHAGCAPQPNKIYRWNGSAWIAAVAATDVTGTLTDSQISDLAAAKLTGQITGTQITNGAISTPKLAAGAVTAATIASNTITAGQIASNTITASQIAAATITANEIAGNTITASKIASGTITTGQIAAGGITGTNIAGGTITATNMAVNSIVAGAIAAGAVTAGTIAANAVAAGTIAANAVTTSTINGNAVTVAATATTSSLTGNGGTQLLADFFTPSFGASGVLSVTATWTQSYSSGIRQTNGNLLVDGVSMASFVVTGDYVSTPALSCQLSVGTGTHRIQLGWYGQDGTVTTGPGCVLSIGQMR